ncbi:nck-associated protein 5-like isoform X3 [Mugil cephalus]|uniref:nck-associated protein 5-like isoform X3 n=1 Tax=Mugil cephalus TaxID=48193 RepID=UPI001FB80DCF|nr:nck-associated protein 5-like isoform X3 [Mugil cephalus]
MHQDAAPPPGEKLAVARLQREVARSKSEGTMREKLIHELEEERRLRLESEKRLREVTEESELGRAQMVSLQLQFSRMEETVRSLLQNQGGLEQTAVDTVDIMKAYKDKLSEEVKKQQQQQQQQQQQTGPEDNGSPLPDPGLQLDPEHDASQAEEDKDKTKLLAERLKALEEENSALALENENQREQYERCLDEVANQVVQALLTQKDLREECLKLRTRVFDLEQQNRALSVLFQQRIKPASDLLLQKLHSRIMDLSAADLLLEPERSKAFLLSRNTDSPSNEVQLNGKAGLPVAKCLSQLSLTVPAPIYQRSSRSSSELSLSSACSEFSSGSYTWNDGRSSGKMPSLTWEKRLSLGSSAPSNICAPPEEQLPTRRKESHILEGLRKLQRRKHRSLSASSKVSKSGYKDCMNSNEGIYSLGIKSSSKGVTKPSPVSRTSAARGKQFSYDSDDADDELAQSSCRDNIPTKDGWFNCKSLSHSISDSLCSLEGSQDSGADGTSGPMAAKNPPAYDSKDRPEKLMSFINSLLPEGGRKSAFSKPSMLRFKPSDPKGPILLSDMDDPEELKSECSDSRMSFSHPPEQVERPSRDPAKLLTQQCLRREQGRTQSADGRPRPFSLIKEPKGAKYTQSEESIVAIFDAEGEPIELCAQKLAVDAGHKVVANYAEIAPQERPTRQKSTNSRNYTVLESPEKPSEYHIRTSKASTSREGSAERLSMQLNPQRKLIKPPSNRANKGHSIPPMNEAACPKSSGSKIPGRNKPSGSPLRLSKGCSTEPSNSGNSGPSSQEKNPSSPTVKLSRFIKTPGTCSQSPKAVNSKLPSRTEWSKSSSSGSPHLSRRHLEYADNSEQPTRDKHCETSKNKLRSPSPPPPPGRTTSLLIRPNYEGSPQAHKTGVAQPSAPTTVRGPPPSYHTSLVPNMQATLPIKDKDCLDLDAGYGTALAPQKLVDKTSQHLQKSPAMTQTPTKGTSKRITTKDYLPSANSGCAREPENAPKGSKNVPPPYSALRGSSLQNSFASKRGSTTHENVHQSVQKTSISLPISLQDAPQGQTESQHGKTAVSPPSSAVISPNPVEKTSKTRIPMGFKAFLKSPPSHKNSLSVPGKQEKDHINAVSKETVTSNASTQCDSMQSAHGIDPPPKMSVTEGKGEVQCRLLEEELQAPVLAEEGDVCDKGKRSSQLFSRSISVTTKPHLKPALGMNGAKARSQSFSTNYIEKPNINVLEGPGKIRTHIITNSGERGNSLSRQSSLEAPSVGLAESPIHSPRTRLSHYGGMTGSNIHSALPERTSKPGSKGDESQGAGKGEAITSPSLKEVRSLPVGDRIGLNNIRKPAKVASHPQFQPPPSCVYSLENSVRETEPTATTPNETDLSQADSPNKTLEMEEKRISSMVCTIEEKVMMGIQENVQKCQEQGKVAASEPKQKTGPSLANWFGLRKSKLPALGGKKAESPKGKEEKKELKIGSVLGGKQVKSDKKKDKKKNENQQKDSPEMQNLAEVNNKLSSIMDHCNNQMGQITSQIQCTTGFIGKDQFVKELLGRAAVKSNSVAAPPPGISTPKKHAEMKGDMEICTDTATLLMTEKIKLKAENEEGHIPDTACQGHMIGSSCQMRTLDSGIGTFPLPDSVTRANSRHIPKSESSPAGVTAGSSELDQELPSSHPDPSQPDVKVPSPPKTRLHAPATMGHSLSDPTVTCSVAQDTHSRLPKLASSDAIRTKRSSLCAPRSSMSGSTEEKEERKMRSKELDMPGERALIVCTYSGSSSDTETEPEGTGSTVSSPQRTPRDRTKTGDSVDEETLKRASVEKPLSIMDYYQHDMFSHLEQKDSRRISQYNLLHKESSLDGTAGDRLSKEISLEKLPGSGSQSTSLDFSLESLNQLNHSSSSLYPPDAGSGVRRGRADAGQSAEGRRKPDEPSSSAFAGRSGADPVGSLSDSLYDSFSSCTSQGSNDV